MSSSPHYEAKDAPTELKNKEAIFEPTQLNIVWGKDNRYWKMPDNGKKEPAELRQVCWLEVSGIFPRAETGKKYKISFTLSFKDDAFGWNNCPVYVMAKFGKKGKYTWNKVLLQPNQDKDITADLEITAASSEAIHFGLYEVWSGKWKGGLLLHKATITQVD